MSITACKSSDDDQEIQKIDQRVVANRKDVVNFTRATNFDGQEAWVTDKQLSG